MPINDRAPVGIFHHLCRNVVHIASPIGSAYRDRRARAADRALKDLIVAEVINRYVRRDCAEAAHRDAQDHRDDASMRTMIFITHTTSRTVDVWANSTML